MIREDTLLALKEAEEKRNRLVEDARKNSEANLAKAKRDAALKVEQGKTKSVELRETLLEAKVQTIENEAKLVRERGEKNAQRLKASAEQNVEMTVTKLIATFERELDV